MCAFVCHETCAFVDLIICVLDQVPFLHLQFEVFYPNFVASGNESGQTFSYTAVMRETSKHLKLLDFFPF